MDQSKTNYEKLFWVYILGFFISIQYGVIAYSGSTFLSGLMEQKNIWVIYTLGSILAIVLNFNAPRLLKKMSLGKFWMGTVVTMILTTTLLTIPKSNFITCLEYIFYYALSAMTFMLCSVILEEFTKNSATGGTRGKYNAITSGGYLLAPFISSIFIMQFGIEVIFILSSIFSFCALVIFYFFLIPIPKISVENRTLTSGLKKLFKNRDLLYITLAQFGITVFYTLAVIYLPFKLLAIGIPLTQYLSVLLPVALSPFLFMPPLLGYVEDQMRDEKEILILAYFGIILVVALMAFVESSSLLLWGIILFFSRLCASSAEISTNSYFYKKINKDDVSLISIFLTTESFAVIIFTPILSYLLFATDLKVLFLSVSFFLCFVLVLVSKIHDTKNYEKHQAWKDIWKRSKKRSKERTAL